MLIIGWSGYQICNTIMGTSNIHVCKTKEAPGRKCPHVGGNVRKRESEGVDLHWQRASRRHCRPGEPRSQGSIHVPKLARLLISDGCRWMNALGSWGGFSSVWGAAKGSMSWSCDEEGEFIYFLNGKLELWKGRSGRAMSETCKLLSNKVKLIPHGSILLERLEGTPNQKKVKCSTFSSSKLLLVFTSKPCK